MNHFKIQGDEVQSDLWSAEAGCANRVSILKGSGMAWFRVALSAEQQRVVNEERESHPNRRIRQKMLVLWLLHCGLTHKQAAEVAGIGRTTVHRIVAAFREGGLGAVRQWNVKGPASEMAAYRDLIRESFERQPARAAAKAAEQYTLAL